MLRPLKLLAPLWLVLLACADRAAPSAGDSRLPPGALVRIGTLAFRHPGTVALVASADGSKLIAASESSARVFDAASGDELARYDTHGRPAFSSDGRTMIGKRSIFDSALELRDAESGSTRSKLEYSGSVSAIALSADAARAAIARDQLLEFFDVASAATVRRMSIKYGQISALIFLPGTSSVACGGADGKIELLSVETEEVRVLREARSGAPRISALAHSADGRTLAAGDEEGNIFLIAAGGIRELAAGDEKITALAFSRDGANIFSAGEGGRIARRSIETGADLSAGIGFFSAVEAIAVDPGGGEVAIAAGGAAAAVHELETGRKLRELPAHRRRVRTIAYAPAGKELASGGNDGRIRIGESINYFAHENSVRALAFSPDGRRLVSGGHEGMLAVYRESGAILERELGERGAFEAISSVCWSPDGAILVAGDTNGGVTFWEAASGTQLVEVDVARSFTVSSVGFSPDGKYFAATSSDVLFIWDARSGAAVSKMKTGAWSISRAAWAPDSERIAFGDSKGRLWIASVREQKILALAESGQLAITAVAWSPDGSRVLSGGRDTTVLVWDVAKLSPPGEEQREELELSRPPAEGDEAIAALSLTIPPPPCAAEPGRDLDAELLPPCAIARAGSRRMRSRSDVELVAWSPDGQLVATGRDQSETVDLWDVKTGQRRHLLHVSEIGARAIAFSPDSQRVAVAASIGRAIRLFDTRSGRKLARLSGAAAIALAWSPAGDLLAAVDEKGRATLFEVELEQERGAVEMDSGPIAELTFSPDGGKLIATNAAWAAAVFDARTLGAVPFPEVDDDFEELPVLSGRFTSPEKLILVTPSGFFSPPGHLTPFSGLQMPATVIWAIDHSASMILGEGEPPQLARGLKERIEQSVIPQLGEVEGLALGPGGKLLATGQGHLVRVRSLPSGADQLQFPGHSGWVERVSFSAGGIVWTADGTSVQSWDAKTGAHRSRFETSSRAVLSLDGKFAASGAEGKIIVLDLAKNTRRALKFEGSSYAAMIVFSPEGKYLAADENGAIRMWNLSIGTGASRVVRRGEERVTALGFTPGAGVLAIAAGKTIELWSTGSAKRLGELSGHEDDVTELVFSRDGRTLASSSRDHSVRLWSLGDRAELGRLIGHTSIASSVAFCGERRLVSGGWDDVVRVWDLGRMKELAVLRGHDALITSVACSAGGELVASSSWDATAIVWDLGLLPSP